MNVRPDQLASVIQQQLYPVYMVSGDEPLQHMEALDSIRGYLRDNDFSEREVLDVDISFDWNRLNEEASNLSLFASRRIIELRLPSAKPGKQGAVALKDYLSRIPEDTVLLLNTGKVDGNAKKSAWFKAVDQAGIIVQCWPVQTERLTAWLKQRFHNKDMQPDADALAYVSQHVEGNLLAAVQEIDKLYLLLGPGKVSYNDVAQAITAQSRYSVFELMDVVLAGDRARTVKIINGLRAEDVAIQVILWAVVKDLRLLVLAAGETNSVDMRLKRSGVWQNRIRLFKQCLSRHSERALQTLLKRCSLIDAAGKGVADADPWQEMETLCFRLAGSSKRR
jgi:DNA polymerase-3 subunit delta